MRVAKITLYNHNICYAAIDKIDSIALAMQKAPQTVIRCGMDVFKANTIASIEATDLSDDDLPEHLKGIVKALPAPSNQSIRELPVSTVILHEDGTLWTEYINSSLKNFLSKESGNYILATCHYRGSKDNKEFILKKQDVKEWLVCSISEEKRPIVHESYGYGVSRF